MTPAHDIESLAAAAGTIAAGATPPPVLRAFLPPPGAAEITLRVAATLDLLLPGFLRRATVNGLEAAVAIYILRHPREALAAHYRGDLDLAAIAALDATTLDAGLRDLRAAIDRAFEPIASDAEIESFDPPGVGWWLHLLDRLAAEYSSAPDALLDLSLAKAFCLLAAIAERAGTPAAGPTFAEREILSRLKTGAAAAAAPPQTPATPPPASAAPPPPPPTTPPEG